MPLTRRVQVYIGAEASEALDRIVARGLTITEAVERGLLRIDPKFLTKDNGTPARPAEPTIDDVHFQQDLMCEECGGREKHTAGCLLSNANSLSGEAAQKRSEKKAEKAGRKAELRESVGTFLDATGPTVESGRGKASVETRPLERGKVTPIPKPGKKS